MAKAKENNYTAASIKDLTDKEHTRARPALIFGGETGDQDNPFSSMKLTLVREIIDNSVGEVIQGYGDKINITFHEDDSFTVLDNGRGLPVDVGKTAEGKKVSGIYKCLAMVKSGGNLDKSDIKISTSLNGVGAASSVIMSEYAIVKSYRNNKIHELHFWDGDPGFFKDPSKPSEDTFTPIGKDLTKLVVSPDKRPTDIKKQFKTGTEITLKIKDDLFPTTYPYSKEDIEDRMRGTASLLKGLHINIKDKKKGEEKSYTYQNGLIDLLEISQAQEPLATPISLEGSVDYEELGYGGKIKKTANYQIIFNWTPAFDYYTESYVNTIRTRLGGVHEIAFQRALVASFVDKFKSMRGVLSKGDPEPNFDDFSEGLSCIISVYVPEPSFSGQAKEELSGRDLQKAFINGIKKDLDSYTNASKNYDNLKKIGDKVCAAAKNRAKAREMRDLKRQKSALSKSNTMPPKLVDCRITHDPLSELIICEGDSASGSVKSARNAEYQAVMPIRGKIINTSKESIKKILQNKEVQDIIKALDCGVGEDCRVEDGRYQIISIAADADPDGKAICCLVYALVWNLFPDYIKKGRFFKIETPLFIINIGKDRYYAMSDAEKNEILKKHDKKKTAKISRAKGLGELPREIMSEFGLNHETRVLTQIQVQDVEEAERMLEVIMGSDIESRKKWIEDNPVVSVSE